MAPTPRYTLTVHRVLSPAQQELLRAQRDLADAGDRRDGWGCDQADEAIAEAEAALQAAGEEPAPEGPVAAPLPWTAEMGRACFRRLFGTATLPDGVSVERLAAAQYVAGWFLTRAGYVPHELVPYLPGMVEPPAPLEDPR